MENSYGVNLTINNSKFFTANSSNEPPKRDFSASMAKTKGKMFKSNSKPFLDRTNKFSQHTSGALMSPVASTHTSNKFTNIIIIVSIFLLQKGRTITKKDIFDLRDYFEKLSGGK